MCDAIYPAPSRALGDIGITAEEFGGKAARLSDALRWGLRVPHGVAVPFLEADRFLSCAASAQREYAGALLERLFITSAPTDRIAVRSSAADEDLSEESGAGRYLTLFVEPRAEACTDATVEVLRHARFLRRKRCGVLVQSVPRVAYAGVAFSRSPLSGEEGFVRISSARGLGEAVVRGARAVDERLVSRHSFCVRGVADQGGLSRDGVKRVVALVLATEILFEGPQDVEWCAGDADCADLYLLQARPITTLGPLRDSAAESERWASVTKFF